MTKNTDIEMYSTCRRYINYTTSVFNKKKTDKQKNRNE